MKKQINRLPTSIGLFVNQNETVAFSFEGKTYTGLAGDTIASALAANNVWLLSRSFKYHRPRGMMSMAGLEANTLVQLEGEPNVAADRRKITPNLQVSGQNYNGSLENDKDAKVGTFSKFMPVGFYYKAFYRPKGIWQKFWEPVIRKRAGLGKINFNTPHNYFDKSYKFCDVAVIGSGPAGLNAALVAAKAGAEVILIEQESLLGGSLNYSRFDAEGTVASAMRNELIEAVITQPNIEVLTNAVCNAWFADNWLPIIQGNRMYKLRAKEMVLASGKMEQPAIFHNNDLPGILLGSAAQRLIRLYGVRPGQRAVILTANDDGYATALDLFENDVEIVAIADLRTSPAASSVYKKAQEINIPILTGHTVFSAEPRADKNHIERVELKEIIGQGQCAEVSSHYDCDLLCVSIGFTPTYQLALQSGGKISYDDDSARFSITQLPNSLHLAGAVNGYNELSSLIDSGKQAAKTACNNLGLTVQDITSQQTTTSISNTYGNHPWPIFPHPKGKEFVDLDEDLQYADIVNACKDGYSELELVKRYSTVGMGPSQGRHSALATARIVADQTQRTVAEVGVTTARPPFRAEKLGVIAGRSFDPERLTAIHHRHKELGAQMITAGVWWRPAYYGQSQNRDQCIRNENLTIRNNVGLIDVSTLGGLEVRGPDAAEFLNRMYTFAYAKQKVGMSRYLLMTNPAGTIIDDGVACRFSNEHFYVTATTGGVDNVYRTMLWWNTQWRLDVDVTNVTTAYAGVNIAGPNSREVLHQICHDIDLTPEEFPYLAVREGTVAHIPARLLRVGFVGELGYEIHVPSSQGEALWDALLEAGKEHNIQPVGIEAQRLLRLEKGHIIVSQDTDAMTTPQEVHMTWAIAKKKPFFVGGRSLQLLDNHPSDRKLIGFAIDTEQNEIPKESNIILDGNNIVGHITSIAHSPSLNKIIGLAYAKAGTEPGMQINIKLSSGAVTQAQVVEMPFYDPDNKRQEM
jgi:sarcosine oxidase subunit alpha